MKSDVISSELKTSKSEVICFSILFFACHFIYTRTFIFNLKLRLVNLRLSTPNEIFTFLAQRVCLRHIF